MTERIRLTEIGSDNVHYVKYDKRFVINRLASRKETALLHKHARQIAIMLRKRGFLVRGFDVEKQTNQPKADNPRGSKRY